VERAKSKGRSLWGGARVILPTLIASLFVRDIIIEVNKAGGGPAANAMKGM
jgi:hypothetical protein